LGVEGVVDVVRHGRLRWFGYLKQKGRADWVFTCRSFEVSGPKTRGRSRKTWVEYREFVRQDLHSLNLNSWGAQDRPNWKDFIREKGTSNPCRHGKMGDKPIKMMMMIVT